MQPFDALRAEGLCHQRDRDRPERARVERERELRVQLIVRSAMRFRIDEILWGRLEEASELTAAIGWVVLVQQQQRDLGVQREPHLKGDN